MADQWDCVFSDIDLKEIADVIELYATEVRQEHQQEQPLPLQHQQQQPQQQQQQQQQDNLQLRPSAVIQQEIDRQWEEIQTRWCAQPQCKEHQEEYDTDWTNLRQLQEELERTLEAESREGQ